VSRIVRRINGICHWVDEERVVRSRGRRIELSDDGGRHFERVAVVDLGLRRDIASRSRLGARLMRAGIKHCLQVADDRLVVFAGTGVHVVELSTGQTRRTATLVGSRPLRVAFDGRLMHFGDYRSNPERSPVTLWRSADLGETWQPAHVFTGVRHIHAAQHDPLDGSLWVTTGDLDHESTIWRAELDTMRFEPVHSGSQQSRAIDLLFTPEGILFGSDAPEERNWIHRLARDGSRCERLHPVAGPVFHARSTGDAHYFSTACEPSHTNTARRVDVVRYHRGAFSVLANFAKDRWHLKYFQYGQVSFAEGPGAPGELWLSPFATNGDQTSLLVAPNAKSARGPIDSSTFLS